MRLISVEQKKENWKVCYKAKATDGEYQTITYPSDPKDLGMGKPTAAFSQAIAKFLPIAIAICHLNRQWWLENGGKVIGVKVKDTKDDRAVQISFLAEDDIENFDPIKLTSHWAEVMPASSVIQATDPSAYSLGLAIAELETEAEKYAQGERYSEQLEIPGTEEKPELSIASQRV